MSWIRFNHCGCSKYGKTLSWTVTTLDGSYLGDIKWYAPWRKYAFEPASGSVLVFEERCLRDIADFCEKATREHKAKIKGNP